VASHAKRSDSARDSATRPDSETTLGSVADVSHMVVEHMAIGVIRLAGDGRVVFANPAACRLFELSAAECSTVLVDDLLRDAVCEDETPLVTVEHPAQAALRTGRPADALVIGLGHPSLDTRRWLLVRAVPEPAPGTSATGVVMTFEDITTQKATESALLRHARLVEQVHEAVVVWDWERGISFWNRGAEELYGYTADEALGRTSHELLQSGFPAGRDAVRAALERDGEWSGDLRRRQRDGTRIVVDAKLTLVGHGIDAVVVEAGRDVTSRRRAEDRQHFLTEAGRILSSSLDIEVTLTTLTQLAVPAMADWCVVDLVDREGTLCRLAITHRDPALAPVAEELQRRYARLPPDQPHTLWTALRRQRPFLDPSVDQDRFVAQARDDRHAALLRQLGFAAELVIPLIARNRVLGAITLVLSDDERSFQDEDMAHAVEVGRTAALAIDNARLYADVRAAEAYYRSLLAGTADGVIVTNETGRYIEVNAAAERMLGYSAEELRALQQEGGTVSAEDPALRAETWLQLQQTGQWSGQWTARRKDGSTISIDASVTRVTLPEHSVYIAIWRDASQRMRLERLQRDFFAMVAHDLRNPLTVVRSNAQLLQRRGEYRAATVAGILAASDRMARLISDLVDLERLQDGHIVLNRAPVDLEDMVKQVVTALPEATQRRVLVDGPASRVAGLWDADRLGQVVQNLIDNAASHAPESQIRVRVEQSGAEARVTVTDDGPGISQQHVPLLFERFYRAGATGAGGLGLGLHICRLLIEAHEGKVGAQSAPGQGSAFWFTLPGAS
jgi:PAS domain S-box-containing protein